MLVWHWPTQSFAFTGTVWGAGRLRAYTCLFLCGATLLSQLCVALDRRLVAGGALFPRAGPPAAGRWTLGSADFGRLPGAAGYCRQICLTQTLPASLSVRLGALCTKRAGRPANLPSSAGICVERSSAIAPGHVPVGWRRLSSLLFNGRASPVGDWLREFVLPSLFSCADNFNFGALHSAPG